VKSRQKTPKLWFVIGDTHFGSRMALMPPQFRDSEGGLHLQNETQKWLWKCWVDFSKWTVEVAAGEPYGVVIDGDVTEGVHHGAGQLVTADFGEHIRMAVQTLAPLTEQAEKVYLVVGTECHTRNAEYDMGHSLGAEKNQETGTFAFDRLLLDVNGCVVSFSHHVGTSTRIALYATQLGVALAEEQSQAARHKLPVPRVVCRAHRHTYGLYEDAAGMCITGPAWQALTRFGHKVATASTVRCGGYALDFRNQEPGELPVVHRRIYRPRTQEVIS
jgi:hypothetical protein